MFTGIVEELGEVRSVDSSRLVVACREVAADSTVGASVSVNGVCLTVVANDGRSLSFDLSEETFRRTALSRLEPGAPVNLERPVTLVTRLGGHLVQGHVDGVGRVLEVQDGGTARIEAPSPLARYLVEKGSVAVDGVSLTVAGVEDGSFTVALIPHTLAATTLGRARTGDPVNLEVDVVAKYLERLVEARNA
jgi:riboflavin synthase